jgi:histidinol-phosphate aminotransferase
VTDVLSFLRAELGQLQSYSVADASGLIKLDAMENPYSLPEEVKDSWLQFLKSAQINRYPEPEPEILKNKLRERFGPQDNSALLFGNGSDELIQLLVMAIAKPDACILTVSPSFSMYAMIGDIVGVTTHQVALDENYELDCAALLNAIEQYNPAVLFLAYPNNPTGNLWKRADIEKILSACKGFVVIDEAYGPFASDSFAGDLVKHENLLLLRTASKLGLAGIRFGWLAANPRVIAELNKLRLPYNINQLTQMTLEFALDNYPLFAEQAQAICRSRAALFASLSAMDGIMAYPSAANFILVKLHKQDATRVFESLLKQKILVKNLSQQNGLEQCLRITVGTEDENNRLLQALGKSLNQ